jgi:hypothetical protein
MTLEKKTSAKVRIRQIRADPDVPLGPGNKAYVIDFQEFFGALPGPVRRAGLPPRLGPPVLAVVRAARYNLPALGWIFGRLMELMSRLIYLTSTLRFPFRF